MTPKIRMVSDFGGFGYPTEFSITMFWRERDGGFAIDDDEEIPKMPSLSPQS